MPKVIVPPKTNAYQYSGEMPLSEQRRLTWLEVIAFLERMFIIFCAYTLSIGPMYWQWADSQNAVGPLYIAAFYRPLQLLGNSFPFFGEWLNWYICLWIL